MLIQEVRTEIAPAEVLARARDFFLTRFSPYGAFVEQESESHLVLHLEAGELVIGVEPEGAGSLVRASASRPHHEVSQFLVTLAPAEEVRQNRSGPGSSGAG